MNRIVSSLVFGLLLAGSAVMIAEPASAVPSDRKEVTQRLELNEATAEQLAATGAVTLEQAKKIVDLREQLGSFQSYEDLQELELPDETFKQLQYNTTISGIAADCNC